MLSLEENIRLVEGKRLGPTLQFVETLFLGAGLPSHDHLHHLRVWNFIKQLLEIFKSVKTGQYTFEYLEALFFSCIFHDTGLVQSVREDHGEISAGIARNYLTKLINYKGKYLEGIIDAISRHDDKTYLSEKQIRVPGFYEFLTVADDLDALGALGLMRYFEIYFYRGVEVTAVKDKIYKNLNSRFDFVKSFLTIDPGIHNEHRKRFDLSLYYLENLSLSNIQTVFKIIEVDGFLPQHNNYTDDPLLQGLIETAKKEGDIYQ